MNMGYFHAYFHNMNRDTFEHSQKISIMEPFANRKKFDFRYLTRFCTRLWRKQVFLQIILISSVWNMWNLYWWLLPSTSKLAKPIQKKVEVSINSNSLKTLFAVTAITPTKKQITQVNSAGGVLQTVVWKSAKAVLKKFTTTLKRCCSTGVFSVTFETFCFNSSKGVFL